MIEEVLNAKQPSCLYAEIIADAKRGCIADFYQERDWFLQTASGLTEVIQKACLSQFPSKFTGKIVTHNHQRRNGKQALRNALEILSSYEKEISEVGSFDELHDLVGNLTGSVPRISKLAVYDISERIGWFLGLEPKNVHLHSGTLAGYRAMDPQGSGNKISLADFPKSFRELSAAEIESVLCVYKNVLKNPRAFRSGRIVGGCGTSASRKSC